MLLSPWLQAENDYVIVMLSFTAGVFNMTG